MSEPIKFKFCLYVAGDTHNSAQATANLKSLCGDHLVDRHEIEIVDVFQEPNRTLMAGILMTPTLVRLSPSPTRKIVGTLSQTDRVLQVLGL